MLCNSYRKVSGCDLTNGVSDLFVFFEFCRIIRSIFVAVKIPHSSNILEVL